VRGSQTRGPIRNPQRAPNESLEENGRDVSPRTAARGQAQIPVIGRDEEIRRTMPESLQPPPQETTRVLIGEPGWPKPRSWEGVAQRIVNGDVASPCQEPPVDLRSTMRAPDSARNTAR